MKQFLKNNLFIISCFLVPILYFWDPNWLSIMGVRPYWSIYWLFPFAIMYGYLNGIILALFMGIILDSLNPSPYTHIPGLILCGFWFARLGKYKNVSFNRLKFGLFCSIGSLICGLSYYIQVILRHFSERGFFWFSYGIRNLFAQVLITGLLAPIICSWLLILFNKRNTKIP
tara:strand:- start:678 stop:1193 length:516 start_codon:yes stop_codon:yes gene_type:complete